MRNIFSLTKRNLLLFFRSKSDVFFSFLSVIIIVAIYALFLSDLQVQNLEATVGKIDGIKALVNSWIMAGVIAVSTVTLSLGALGRMVSDRQSNAMNDFLVSPIKRREVFASYILSTLIIVTVLSITLILIAEGYILSSGGVLLTFIQILKVLGITIIGVMASSLLMLFIVSFLKSEQTYSLVSTIVGTMIGFVTSAYIPIGIMPKFLQVGSNILPASQCASLLRKVFLEVPIKEVFGGSSKAISAYSKMQGVNLYIGKTELSSGFMLTFMVCFIILFSIINLVRFKKMKNK